MPKRINEDHKQFRDVVSGRIRKALKDLIGKGDILKKRGKNGDISVNIPNIETPHIVHGPNPEGIGRGAGEKGDVVGKDEQEGDGDGSGKAGKGEKEGIMVTLDLEELLQLIEEDWKLPKPKPKPNETHEDVKIKYNSISLIGPESLRHTRKTILQAMKRQISEGSADELHYVPGQDEPTKLIIPNNNDKRYRQWKEHKVPSTNALIIFIRDGSGSMDQNKCDLASNVAWWLNAWLKRFYEKTERMFIWHDTNAHEVNEEKFFKYRNGGGTQCSSAIELLNKQFEDRYPPSKWNIYAFYFTDGDNYPDDSAAFINAMKKLTPDVVNLFGLFQIKANYYTDSLRQLIDKSIDTKVLGKNIKTTSICEGGRKFTDAEQNEECMNAIKHILGDN